MRKFRMLAAATAVSLAGASVAATSASAAQASGVGTATVGSTLLGIDLGGDVVNVDVAVEQAQASIDPAVGSPEAFTTFAPLDVASSIAAELNKTMDEHEARTTQGVDTVDTATLAFPDAVAPVIEGSVQPTALTASVSGGVAQGSLDGSLANVSIAGGLGSVDSVSHDLITRAGPGGTTANQGASVDSIVVLRVDELLAGLGIDVANLPSTNLVDMLNQLDVSVAGVGDASAVESLLTDLTDAEGELQDVLDSLLPDLTDPVKDILTANGIAVPDPLDLTAVADALAEVEALHADTLGDLATTVADASLLTLTGVDVQMVTTAKEALADSLAQVTAEVGSIEVGGNTLPGIDLVDTDAEIDATIGAVTNQINDVLAAADPGLVPADPDLADLVTLSFLDQETEVGESDGYTQALASLTAATVSVNPPVDLAGIISALDPANGVGQEISGLGGPALDLGTGTADLETALGADPLEGGAEVRVFSLSSSADYTAAAGGPGDGDELPRTGASTTVGLAIGAVLLAGALGGRRLVRDASRL